MKKEILFLTGFILCVLAFGGMVMGGLGLFVAVNAIAQRVRAIQVGKDALSYLDAHTLIGKPVEQSNAEIERFVGLVEVK